MDGKNPPFIVLLERLDRLLLRLVCLLLFLLLFLALRLPPIAGRTNLPDVFSKSFPASADGYSAFTSKNRNGNGPPPYLFITIYIQIKLT